MKKPLKHFVLNALAILLLTNILPGVSFGQNLSTLLLTALILSLINLLIKPLLKIVFLPINLLTFGLAGWLIQVITLYLTTLLVEDFVISSFYLDPVSFLGMAFPKVYFSGFFAYLSSSFVLSLLNNFLYWLL